MSSPPDPRAGHHEIEVDTDVSSSSDYDSEGGDLQSLTSSIYNYIYENGRTYHSYRSGTYVLPNDEREQDRLDMLHHVFRLALHGNLCHTQLAKPQKILDVGTGTGIWAIDMADEFPAAEVIGVDLSPIQPSWVPPNVKFMIDDSNSEWDFPPGSFDFIHVRGLSGCIDHWPAFLRQCYRHLKPGGRIEISDFISRFHCDDDSFPKDCFLRQWEAEFFRLADVQGRLWDTVPRMRGFLESAEFKNVEYASPIIPIGTWPRDPRLKEMGRYIRYQLVDTAAESYTMALFTRFGNWSSEEVQVLLAHLRRELLSNAMHVYTYFSIFTAQKPQRPTIESS
ncbi:S-adenosyl-L-methionine-dependent methyltransferase [Penicillium chermesinum]|uniref:S-adenosyl-L-methionine-dependent methyltransferase n=1 Tax=Penicillium chermesinum TaxID=63820 RepID=A0A9W9TJF4_9EURO|nr:S-adenosyl-L-methionine-dependent methyltransferase [Penicillium chermesinum]KAJ5224958.1 S-adenosyl-L-methionine-dependent methyltransferase [Penicillium chermesinum]KAJ6151689.1 S-adenosyl-L-methionine-dependent methyltransferase [Penicillium chermesinum]